MRERHILITNQQLSTRSGTELYVMDLARSLQSLGHRPIVFASKTGALAESLVRQSIPVLDNLRDIAVEPDLIHGHHNLETMSAMLRFPNSPGIFVCHDSFAWHDRAPEFPRIYRYVAVDNACYDRLSVRDGVPTSKIELIQNGVDLKKFRSRGVLPQTPRRALLMSNYAGPSQYMLINRVCRKMGIQLDAVGSQFGNVLEKPEQALGQYDVVFAKGRCAWEALAVGAAVIVCDTIGCGAMVTSSEIERMAASNFGRRLLNEPISTKVLIRELKKYNSDDAALVSKAVRKRSNLSGIAHQLTDLYEAVIREHAEAVRDRDQELVASSHYLQWWAANRTRLVKESEKKYRPDRVVKRAISGLRKQAVRKLMVRRVA